MKKIFLSLIIIGMFFLSCKDEAKKSMETEVETVTDSIVNEEPEITEVPMDSIAMQKAWEAYMTPSEPHQMMAAEVGTWTNEMTFWMAPNTPPEKSTSTGVIKMIMGGRYQESNHTGMTMGMPFEGRSTLAYDNATKELISTWIDNFGTGMMVMRGTFDDSNKTITFTGNAVDPMTGKEKQVREIYTIIDDNTRKMEMFENGPDGKEFKNMEIMMKRK
jgi:hypothetical protein